MNVAFGIGFGANPVLLLGADVPKFTELVRRAEGYGALAIGTYDSGFLGGDAYVRATLMAQATTRAAVGLRPSNPLTREPQIMASFLASIRSLAETSASACSKESRSMRSTSSSVSPYEGVT